MEQQEESSRLEFAKSVSDIFMVGLLVCEIFQAAPHNTAIRHRIRIMGVQYVVEVRGGQKATIEFSRDTNQHPEGVS